MQDFDYDKFSCEKFGGWINFECGDKIVKFMHVKDVDGKIIQLPFETDTKIKDLVREYYEKNKIKVCFIVESTKQLAYQEKFVSNFYVNKDPSAIIFQIYQKDNYISEGQEKSVDQSQERVINIFIETFIGKKLTIEINTKSQAIILMKKIQQEQKIPLDQQHLIYSGKNIQPISYICQYDIQDGSTINLMVKVKQQSRLKKLKQIFCYLFPSLFSKYPQLLLIELSKQQLIAINYKQVRQMKVSSIVKKYVSQMASYWTICYENNVINPNDQLLVIEQYSSFKGSEIIKVKLYKYGKYLFLSSIREIQFQQYLYKITNQQIKQKVNNKKKRLLSQNKIILLPIIYYTSVEFYQPLNSYLRQFKIKKSDKENSIEFNLCCSLYKSLHQLPNFIGQVYRGMKNFNFSNHCQQNNIYCFSSFLSTSKQRKVAQGFATDKDNKIRGSIFIITALTGKLIENYSLFQKEQEVLFFPFTYFYVNKIKKHEFYQQIWLTQLPSPSLFKQNTLIWVDDKPKNNIPLTQSLRLKNLQILYVTSSKLIKVWIQNFLLYAQIRKINLKIITNMVRSQSQSSSEPAEQHKIKKNYEAGLDIVDLINNYNSKIPILIFCGDVDKARQSAMKRMPQKIKTIRITNNKKDLLTFILQKD